MSSEREILLGLEKEKLADIIIDLLSKISESERNKFISKNINTQLALDNIQENDGLKYLKAVQQFCEDCINGEFYTEIDYDNDWDDYDGELDFDEADWPDLFVEYFNIALMYARNKEYDIAFEAFELLINCIHKAEFHEDMSDPESYINVDWMDIFNYYYICIKRCITDKLESTEKSFEVWLDNDKTYTDAFVDNIEEIQIVEKMIRTKMEEGNEEWNSQHLHFELIKKLNEKYNPEFNNVELAKSFLEYNINFYDDISKAYFEIEEWKKAVEIIEEAIEKVTIDKIKLGLKIRLIDCYENLNNFEAAFNEIYNLFKEKPSYDLYIRSRYFAEEINKLNIFINEVVSFLKAQNSYYSNDTLVKVLSYEDLTVELLDFIKTYQGSSRYGYLKYISKSFIYRILKDEKVNSVNLTEYINNIHKENAQGIAELEIFNKEVSNRDYCLNSAMDILKEMVKFHIDAANRSRYERAAYYCSIIRDILRYLDREKEFTIYYMRIIGQNNRRPALKDEMKRKIGY